MPQGNTLFSGTVRENIRMGNLNATEEEMNEALKLAAAYDFVQELPKGIDTVIGERGTWPVRRTGPENRHCKSFREKGAFSYIG